MSPLLSALLELAPTQDPELLEGLERYVELLGMILSPEQLDTYAALVQRTGAVHIFDELRPADLAALASDEAVLATTIMAEQNATMENRRVAALLQQRQT
jgi:hypothetical protein